MTQTPITHHIAEPTLMAYAAGTLPEAFNLIVASHLSLCDHCRAAVEAFDAVGGALLESEGTCAQMSAGSLERVLGQISQDAGEASPPQAMVPGEQVLPAPLRAYIGGDLEDVRWRPVGMGVKQAILKTSPTATARLLFIPAGAAMPDHGHNGTEMTLVLKGAFRDDADRFARGDVETAGADVQHVPVADVDEDCVCLAVTDAPLRFQGVLPRIFQKFARI